VGLGAWVLNTVFSIFPDITPFTPSGMFTAGKALALGQGATGLAGPLAVSVLMVVACVWASWLSFRRQSL